METESCGSAESGDEVRDNSVQEFINGGNLYILDN